MKCQNLYLGKIGKKNFKLSPAEIVTQECYYKVLKHKQQQLYATLYNIFFNSSEKIKLDNFT